MASVVGGAGGPAPGQQRTSPTPQQAAGSGASRNAAEQRLQLLQEMRCQNFDLIRFASYRTACKLRFVQKKLNLNLVDIWNVIEAFRENGLNTLEPTAELNVTRLETLVSSLYHNLNKRLPLQQQVSVEADSSLLLNWLLSAYYVESLGKIRVFSIKVALATMCAGKLMDKLRYMFSQVCDSNGFLVAAKFSHYLKQVLALPAAVYESPSFTFREELASEIFAGNGKVTVNDFMDTMMSDPAPACLVWLPLLHRLASVENVVHATVCDACHRENYTGFRYRCAKCHSFQMCQDCFWRGRVASTHTIEHDVKEYTTYKSPSKQIGHSLRKSFRCVPDKGKANIPRFPDHPEKPLNLSHIVPPSPLPSHNGFPDYTPGYDMGSLDSRSTARSPGKCVVQAMMRLDDEHKLIARYAARLAQEAHQHSQQQQQQQPSGPMQGRTPTDIPLANLDTSRAQRELITQLEAKNREIMREIARLRREQEVVGNDDNPALMSELRALRQRKDELESHLTSLQDSRRHLMLQLEGLMKLLKNHQASPRSTPNSSPRSSKSPPPSSRSAPPTPTPTPGGSGMMDPSLCMTCDVRSTLGGSASQLMINSTPPSGFSGSCLPSSGMTAQQQQQQQQQQQMLMMMNNSCSPLQPGSGGRSLCNDLLEAADSVTNAMSSLVRELNSDFEGEREDEDEEENAADGGAVWASRRSQQPPPAGATLVSASLVLGSNGPTQHLNKDYVLEEKDHGVSQICLQRRPLDVDDDEEDEEGEVEEEEEEEVADVPLELGSPPQSESWDNPLRWTGPQPPASSSR